MVCILGTVFDALIVDLAGDGVRVRVVVDITVSVFPIACRGIKTGFLCSGIRETS